MLPMVAIISLAHLGEMPLNVAGLQQKAIKSIANEPPREAASERFNDCRHSGPFFGFAA